MENIIEIIKKLKNLKYLQPVTLEEIKAVEKELDLKFAEDYVEYVKTYGVISAQGIELTGITDKENLSVVSATKRERSYNDNIPDNMYVIENLGIAGIIILQDEDGKIYEIATNKKPKCVFSSLSEYIKSK